MKPYQSPFQLTNRMIAPVVQIRDCSNEFATEQKKDSYWEVNK